MFKKQRPILVVCHMQDYFPASKLAEDSVALEIERSMRRKERVFLLELSHLFGWNGIALPPTLTALRRLVKGYKRVQRILMHPTLPDGYRVVPEKCAKRRFDPAYFNVVGIHSSLCVRDLAYRLAQTGKPVNIITDACTDGAMAGVAGWASYEDKPENVVLLRGKSQF